MTITLYLFSPGFTVCSMVSRLLGEPLRNRPGSAHNRWYRRTGIQHKEGWGGMKNCVFFTLCLYLCVFQVSALCFTSANISLFERLSRRKDSDSAHIILWDEVVKGRYRSCYTVAHQGHTPAWVRKGGHTHIFFVLFCHATCTLIRASVSLWW